MERERQRQDAFDPEKPCDTSVTTDREKTVFVDLVQETLPSSDEAIRKSLEEHRTEGQGE